MATDHKEHLEKLESKIDKLDERLDSIDKTLVKQEVNLQLHMKRSDALESQIKPIQAHVLKVEGALKALGILALLVGIASGIFGIIKFFI